MDLKKTLNLPNTDFPMRARLTIRDPEFVKFWDKNEIYKKALKKREGRKKFVLHDGPPYANGHIHLGQAMNKVIKDMTVKYKMLKGYYTPYRPGWDAHGMPIENLVLKEFDSQTDMVTIRKRCREFASQWVSIQKEEFKRLGVLGDWNNPYITMSKQYEGRELELLSEVVKKGFIYRGYMPVLWCPTCETALAISEIEYKMMDSPSLCFTMEGNDFKVLIWTTTPWTIISNLALAVHPDYTYVVVEADRERFLLALDLLEENSKKLGWSNYRIVKEIKGKDLEGVSFKHPFFNRESRVLLARFVTMDEGTGIVHIAPGHGREDYVLGKNSGLEIFSPVDEKGKFTNEVPDFEGLTTVEASEKVIEILKKKEMLVHLETIQHNYPICWRCKDPLIFRATEQWFLSVDHDNLRERALDAVRKSKWYPPASKQRMLAAIQDRPDWCISRQRIWGVNIPAFFCSKCGKPVLEPDIIQSIAKIFKKESADSWIKLKPAELLPDGCKCGNCGGTDFKKGMDILDVWFDSGVSSFAGLEKEDWPSNIYLEGPDQHRGWFNSSLMLSLAIKDAPPFDTVVTHGWMLDQEGQSMHKSLGNVTSPREILDEFGADILRLWIASVNWTQDVKYGKEILQRLVDAYRKIRNSFRFMLGNLYDFNPEEQLAKEELLSVDRYILIKLNQLLKTVDKEYNSFNYHRVYRKTYDFIVTTLSSFYFDILKDRLYVEGKKSKKRRSAQTVLYRLTKNLAVILSPILSFMSEEVWQTLFHEGSVFLADFPEYKKESKEEKELKDKFARLLEIREEFHKALEPAQENNFIGNSLEAMVRIKSEVEELYEFEEFLPEFFIVSKVEFVDEVDAEYSFTGELGSYGIKKADGEKCSRCWVFSPAVGKNDEFSNLCKRCVEIVKRGDFE
ncbi:MAG: isoleucine--tRNA ligase [candidate division WOR-3 bacterium]|nr:isoleucine--tRNA ligase [candidate division WOR-3 bacterium]